jgi:hypothetical protein
MLLKSHLLLSSVVDFQFSMHCRSVLALVDTSLKLGAMIAMRFVSMLHTRHMVEHKSLTASQGTGVVNVHNTDMDVC